MLLKWRGRKGKEGRVLPSTGSMADCGMAFLSLVI